MHLRPLNDTNWIWINTEKVKEKAHWGESKGKGLAVEGGRCHRKKGKGTNVC